MPILKLDSKELSVVCPECGFVNIHKVESLRLSENGHIMLDKCSSCKKTRTTIVARGSKFFPSFSLKKKKRQVLIHTLVKRLVDAKRYGPSVIRPNQMADEGSTGEDLYSMASEDDVLDVDLSAQVRQVFANREAEDSAKG